MSEVIIKVSRFQTPGSCQCQIDFHNWAKTFGNHNTIWWLTWVPIKLWATISLYNVNWNCQQAFRSQGTYLHIVGLIKKKMHFQKFFYLIAECFTLRVECWSHDTHAVFRTGYYFSSLTLNLELSRWCDSYKKTRPTLCLENILKNQVWMWLLWRWLLFSPKFELFCYIYCLVSVKNSLGLVFFSTAKTFTEWLALR